MADRHHHLKIRHCRRECLSMLGEPLSLSSSTQTNIMQFFHGDGPAQQFEACNSIGGNYCCVGCSVKSDRIDDIAYSFWCMKLGLQYWQEFLLQGMVWKNIDARPLDKLCRNWTELLDCYFLCALYCSTFMSHSIFT